MAIEGIADGVGGDCDAAADKEVDTVAEGVANCGGATAAAAAAA